MEDLNKEKEIVEYVLRNYPSTRNDDLALIYQYLIHYAKSKMPTEKAKITNYMVYEFGRYLEYIQRSFGLYSFEGITRCRRHLQAKYDDLKPTKEAKKAREEKEKQYKETVREWKKN